MCTKNVGAFCISIFATTFFPIISDDQTTSKHMYQHKSPGVLSLAVRRRGTTLWAEVLFCPVSSHLQLNLYQVLMFLAVPMSSNQLQRLNYRVSTVFLIKS